MTSGDLALCIDDVQSILDYMMKEENLPEEGKYMYTVRVGVKI
jgi:hypothetical protein